MRRWASAGAVVALVAALVGIGAPASAAEPPPGPVDEIMDVTSRAVKSVTASPVGDSVVTDMWRAQQVLIAAGRSTPATLPKPIAPPAALARVAGSSGGALLTSVMLGWAVASNGTLVAVGVATGSDYSSVYCSQPDWYQGVTTFVNLGFTPGCVSGVVEPNTDVSLETQVSYGPMTARILGALSFPSVRLHCIHRINDTPSGYQLVPLYPSGPGTGGIGGGMTAIEGCVSEGGFVSTNAYVYDDSPTGGLPVVGLAVINLSTGAEVARTVPGDPNPTRTPRCELTAGEDTFTGTGNPYTDDEGIPVTAEGLGCSQAYEDFVSSPGRGPGLLPDRITVGSEDENGVITTIADTEVPGEYTPDQQKGLTVGNGHGLVLQKVAGATVSSCMTWAADCANWWAESEQGTSTTSPYRCLFGGQEIALAECSPYRTTFDQQTSTPTITDPISGESVPWSAQPSTGNSLSPGVGPGTGPSPAENCFETGWADVANPIDWVLVPVKCALVWAFVPRLEVVNAGMTDANARWSETLPGKLPALVVGAVTPPDGGSGCAGPHVAFTLSLPFTGLSVPYDGYPLSACDEPMASVATLARTIGSAVLIFFTALGIIRRGSAVVGAPGVGGAA